MYQNNSLDVKNKRVIIFGGLEFLVQNLQNIYYPKEQKYVSQIYIKLDL